MTPELARTRCGYVALVGAPNVGKSTLINALLGQKVSIVTAKPQTTRQRVIGIYNGHGAQIIFLDTPGLITPKYLLHHRMLSQAASAVSDADIVAVMTEVAAGPSLPKEVENVVSRCAGTKPVFLIINKADTIFKPDLLPLIGAFSERRTFQEIIPVSALKEQNLEDLLHTLAQNLPEQPDFYPDDMLSEHPERFFVSEFIREGIFERFRDEVPYSTAVEITEFKDREGSKAFIAADVIVERDSQKAILIGRGGIALKSVGGKVRPVIERFLGRAVYLELTVKVRDRWREDERMLNQLGYTE